MLDQDTARALFAIADRAHATIALLGDRHQLPAVGRGGVLDLAARWVRPEAHLADVGECVGADLAGVNDDLAARNESVEDLAGTFTSAHEQAEVGVRLVGEAVHRLELLRPPPRR